MTRSVGINALGAPNLNNCSENILEVQHLPGTPSTWAAGVDLTLWVPKLGDPETFIEESICINHLPPATSFGPGYSTCHFRFGPLVTPSENTWRGALVEIYRFNLSAAHTQLGIGPMKASELLYI